MLSRVQNSTGNGYFSQAVSEYARRMKPEEKKKNHSSGKTIAEFSEKEWNKLLQKVDYSIENYKTDVKQRQKEALERKKEQADQAAFANGNSGQEYETNVLWEGKARSMRFHKINQEKSEMGQEQNQELKIVDTISDELKDEAIRKIIGNRKNAPYSMLADENGMITYHGVVFQCDEEQNSLCLGDVSDPDQCISVPLESGGRLVVNRNDIDALSTAIGMFSPEDIRRIMQAIAQDGKVKKTEMEIEDMTSGVEVLEKEKEEES